MSPLLPIKETSREVVVEVTRSLQPYFAEITAAWRHRMFGEFDCDGRAMAALERLTIGTGFSIFSQTDFAAFYDSLQHFGKRLAKLKVNARVVSRSLEIYQQLIDPYLEKTLSPTPVGGSSGRHGNALVGQLCSGVGGILRCSEKRVGSAVVGPRCRTFGAQPECSAGSCSEDHRPNV